MPAVQKWYFDMRWTIDYGDYERCDAKLHDALKAVAKKFSYQLEMTIVHSNPDDGYDEEGMHGEYWHPNYHFQIYAQTKAKHAWNGLRKELVLLGCVGITVRFCSTNGLAALKAYSMKPDTAVAGTQRADHPIYLGEDLPVGKWKPFQQELIDYCLTTRWREREILWVYDPNGESGKSKFAKFLKWKHQALRLNWMVAEGMLYLFCQKPSKIVIVNLTKQRPKNVDIGDLYNALESIKDGDVDSAKYQGADVLMLPPHVVVLANHRPELARMTQNRFKCKCIDRSNWTLYDDPGPPPGSRT